MQHASKMKPDIYSPAFLRHLMRKQLLLSITCATAFCIVLFGLPLVNFFAPGFMSQNVGGFTLSWLILGVLFFPFVWVISFIFIKRSIALEKSEVQSVKGDVG